MIRTKLAASLLVAAALLAGCGGGGDGEEVAVGAGFAPASAAAYVVVNTDVASEEWQNADRLLGKFPGRSELLDNITSSFEAEGLDWEEDVKPALGENLNAVWLDLEGGENVVGFLQPKDEAKFDQLVEASDDPPVYRKVEDWTVFADSEALLDRFESARSSGSLAEEDSFEDALASYDEESFVRAWVGGDGIRASLNQAVPGELQAVLPDDLERQLERLRGVSAASSAEADGVSVEAAVEIEDLEDTPTYTAKLPEQLPAGAYVLASFGDLEESLQRGLRSAESQPGFSEQRRQLEQALGGSLEGDIFSLFSREGAFAVYPGEPDPAVLFTLAVDDAEKADETVKRLASLAELGGIGSSRRLEIDGVEALALELDDSSLSFFAATEGDRVLVTTTEELLRSTLGDGARLADDPDFKEAIEAADMPDETPGGFFYANLENGLDTLLEYAEAQGEEISAEARANVEPLRSVVLYGTRDGDRAGLAGFLGIE